MSAITCLKPVKLLSESTVLPSGSSSAASAGDWLNSDVAKWSTAYSGAQSWIHTTALRYVSATRAALGSISSRNTIGNTA